MFLQSSLEKVLKQLPALCDSFEIPKDERNAFIMDGQDDHVFKGELGSMAICVGEIHRNNEYRFLFNSCGKLIASMQAQWNNGNVCYIHIAQ